mgnify:CR=1 FL=1
MLAFKSSTPTIAHKLLRVQNGIVYVAELPALGLKLDSEINDEVANISSDAVHSLSNSKIATARFQPSAANHPWKCACNNPHLEK